MKRIKAISLRTKITILSAVILVAISAGLTVASNYNLDRYFVQDLATAQPMSAKLESIDLSTPMKEEIEYTPNLEAGEDDVIAVAKNSEAIAYFTATRRKSFVFSGLWIMIALALLGIGAIYFLTGKALRPVRNLSVAMGNMDENNLSARVEVDGSSKEIQLLSDTYNHMLERLECAFTQQKKFSMAAAHELKTPLACMRANLEVLQMDANPSAEEYREAVAVASRNTNRLIELVEELLKMNNMEELNFQTVALTPMFDAILDELAPVIVEKKLSVAVACDGAVKGDLSFLYRAFFNLVENAVKYNVECGSIQIKAKREDDRVYVSIADTGIGIPEEEADSVFHAFYRVDKSRSREIGGCGLGLSIVKNIIEKHGGDVSVAPNETGGSIFTVKLQADKAKA